MPIKFVSPTFGITPSSADGDPPARRYCKLENIEVELDEELLLTAGEEPTSFTEAEPHEAWRTAKLKEMKSIEDSGTWYLTDLPPGKRPIQLKWVFKLEKNNHGEVVKHKGRLVPKGYVQRAGIEFDEVFAWLRGWTRSGYFSQS